MNKILQIELMFKDKSEFKKLFPCVIIRIICEYLFLPKGKTFKLINGYFQKIKSKESFIEYGKQHYIENIDLCVFFNINGGIWSEINQDYFITRKNYCIACSRYQWYLGQYNPLYFEEYDTEDNNDYDDYDSLDYSQSRIEYIEYSRYREIDYYDNDDYYDDDMYYEYDLDY